MTIANIDINGHTYTDADWRADWEGTISSIANDIASAVAGAALVGGALAKTLSGSVTLTPTECENRVFTYTGSLGAAPTVNFDVAFRGLATIKNNTNQIVTQALTGGSASVAVPVGGTMLIYCDGVGVYNATGVVTTATGMSVTGNLFVSGGIEVVGTSLFGGAMAVTANVTVNSLHSLGDVGIDTDLGVGDDVTVGGDLTVAGQSSVHHEVVNTGNLVVAGNIESEGSRMEINNATGESRFQFSNPNAMASWIEFSSSETARWILGKNAESETGSNVGSDFEIVAFDDAGELPGHATSWLKVYRANGYVRLLGVSLSPDPTYGAGVLYKDADGFVKITS